MSKNYLNSRMVCVLCLAVLVSCANVTKAPAAAPIGKAEFGDCIQDEDGLECEARMVVTVPVSFGLSQTMDAVTVTTIEEGGEPITLEETIRIDITKSMPKLNYPLKYFHTVAYYPHEEIIKVPHPITGCPGCLDCSTSPFPTCRWTYSGSAKLEDSQGFCNIKSLFDLEYGGCSWWRGERLLGEQATMDNPFATAHCMRLAGVYFHGYEIGESIKSYEIELKLTQGSESHTIILAPMDPHYSTDHDNNYTGNFQLKAQLLGDLDEYRGALELDNYILYIPYSPADNPMVQDYQNNMLLLPREELAKDGGEINKVGISFHAFRSLGSDSRVLEAGDGLHNQLFHKHNFDLQKLTVNPNAETTYLAHGKRDFKGSMAFLSGMEKILQKKITYINNSLVSLTMDAAEIKDINTQSPGIIKEAYVKTFTSFSDEGNMVVVIRNEGSFPTDYIVTVTECTMNILKAIPAQARSMNSEEEVNLKFDIFTLHNLDTTNECLCTLTSPEGEEYDKVWVQFDTKKHQSKYSWEWQQKNEGSEFELPDDANAPVITLNGPNMIVLECGIDTYAEPNAQAVDNLDPCVLVEIGGDMVDTSTCGTYVVTYTAVDSWCNWAEITRTVIVEDTTAPVITLNGPNQVTLTLGDVYVEPGATASDACDDDVPVTVSGAVDTSTIGEYTRTYNAVDDCGNPALPVTRTVSVQALPPDCSDAYADYDCLWPPFRQMVPVRILGVTDPDGGDVTISITSITSDEPTATAEGTAGPEHAPDADGIGADTALLRSERSRTGNGRVYVISFTAVSSQGAQCQASVQVKVPRQRRVMGSYSCEAIDDGQNYDATQIN